MFGVGVLILLGLATYHLDRTNLAYANIAYHLQTYAGIVFLSS